MLDPQTLTDRMKDLFPGTLGMAATGTLLSVWLARQLDPAPPAPSQHPSQ